MDFYDNYYYDYTYGYTSPASNRIMMTIFLICLVVFLAALLVALVSYLIKGFGMYKMAQREEKEYPWLAFVPFARIYLQGELSGDIQFKKRVISNPGIWLIVLPLMGGVVFGGLAGVIMVVLMGSVMAVSFAGGGFPAVMVPLLVLLVLVTLAAVVYEAVLKVLRILIDYQIFSKFAVNNVAIVHAILSVILPLYESICLFVYRNHASGSGQGSEFEEKPPVMPDGGNQEFSGEHVSVKEQTSEIYRAAEPSDSAKEHASEETGAESAPEKTEEAIRPEAENQRGQYVYRDSVEVTHEEPEGYDMSDQGKE